jgi:RNA polymerase sigma factor (sigma-70 family)
MFFLMTLDRNHQQQPSRTWFATTRWSVVLTAGDKADAGSAGALQTLCQSYWYPLYAYVRQKGYGSQDAEDLTQSFFMHLLDKDRLGRLTRDKGKFRSFLLTALNHFLVDHWKRASAQKRGGGQSILRLDMQEAETRYRQEPVDTTTPERLFEQNWAVTLLNTVFEQLQQEQQAQGKGEQFEQLKFCLTGRRSAVPYAELAEKMKVSEGALKVLVHRLRLRYRELLRQEVAHTVSGPDEVEEELQYLRQILSGD